MIRKSVAACAAFALAAVGFARGPDELQGEWKALVIEQGGKRQPEAALKAVTVVIKGDGFALKNRDRVVEEVTLKVDPAKTPRQITLTPVKGPRKGKEHAGIYALEGGKLSICWALPGKERPAAFATAAEAGNFLIVLEPAKP